MADEARPELDDLKQTLRHDLPAGLVVFLVALPLCLGIALASDAPLVSGIVSGIVGGVIVGALSGSALSVSGPAAGLAVIVAEGIAHLGLEVFLLATLIAGAMQIVLGLARAGFIASLFPISVIKGMLAAIGIILILKQIPHALGRDADYEGDLSFWVPGGEQNTFTEILLAVQSFSPGVVVITVLSLAVLLLWETAFVKRHAWSKVVPGPLVAVVLAVAVNELYAVSFPALYVSADAGHLVTIPVFRSVADLRAALAFPDFSAFTREAVWVTAATLAAIASIETLLSVEAVDKLDPYRRVSDTNRELVAQGVGNMVTALVGGLPITAVIVRSSANVYAGGRTRNAALVHGVLLLALVLAVPALLNRIPLAALAAILLVVGYKLAQVSLFKQMYRAGLDQFLPFIVTVVITVVTDLLTGVVVGVVVGAVMVILTNFHSAITVVSEGRDVLVKFSKDVSFLNKITLKRKLAAVPSGSSVLIDGSRAMFVDKDILDVIDDFVASARYRDIDVTIRNVHPRDFPFKLPRIL